MNYRQRLFGKEGVLIFDSTGGATFRIYHNKDKFTDHKIQMSDLLVIIRDEDAFIYNDDYIDYSPETLGLVED